jgi:hypothetical protein
MRGRAMSACHCSGCRFFGVWGSMWVFSNFAMSVEERADAMQTVARDPVR